MKIHKIIYSLFIGLMILTVSSCDPIVDGKSLSNTTNVEGVELVSSQATAGGNLITLEMVTPGVTGYWDYNIGTALTNKVEIIYPIPGKATFTFKGTLGAEFFEKTIDVQIDQLDAPLDQDWYDLVSENTAEGKTWVYAGTGGETGWWYMSDPNNWSAVWWDAGECCGPWDAAGRMTFDLDGAANFTYESGPGATPEMGSFVLDVTNQQLQVNGPNILGAVEGGGNPSGLYNIISLTEDEMILFVPNAAWATGWTYKFKPEE